MLSLIHNCNFISFILSQYKYTMAENVFYSTDGKVLQPGVWKCVIDKLLKMSCSLVGRNIPSQRRAMIYLLMCPGPVCGNVPIWHCVKGAFTGVTKKHCGLDKYIKYVIAQNAEISSRFCGKDTFYWGCSKEIADFLCLRHKFRHISYQSFKP